MSTVAQCENETCNTKAEAGLYPPDVNIVETKEGYVLEADMPGVSKSGLKLSVEDGELIIVGKRSEQAPHGTLLHRESLTADYCRRFKLDPLIDTGKISAKLEQGVLILSLPKSEKAKPRVVSVE
jgi:HSP20 family protein